MKIFLTMPQNSLDLGRSDSSCSSVAASGGRMAAPLMSHLPPQSSKTPDPSHVSERVIPPQVAKLSFMAAASKPLLQPRFQSIPLSSRQYGQVDGKPTVYFTTSEFDAGAALFRHSLIAKFTIGRPTISEIRTVFKENWRITGRATISEIYDGRHLMIILDSEDDAKIALTSPIRKVGQAMFRLFRYTPDYSPRRESTTTTKWVRLAGLHPAFFTKNYVAGIVNVFGEFLDLDIRTKACSSLKYARACVEIDVSKAIPEEVNLILSDGRKFSQKIEVEGNLSYCSNCKIHGHMLAECRKKRKESDGVNLSAESINAVDSRKDAASNMKMVNTVQGDIGKEGKANNLVHEQEGWTEVKRKKSDRTMKFKSHAKEPNDISQGQSSSMLTEIDSPNEITMEEVATQNNVEMLMKYTTVEEVHNGQANELAMVIYDSGLPEHVDKAVEEDTSPGEENVVLPSNRNAEANVTLPMDGISGAQGNTEVNLERMNSIGKVSMVMDPIQVVDANVPRAEEINKDIGISELHIPVDIAKKISSYGSAMFTCDEIDGSVDARGIYLHFKTGCEDDTLIFEDLDDFINKNSKVEQEGSDIPIEETESGNGDKELCAHVAVSSPMSKNHHRKKKKS